MIDANPWNRRPRRALYGSFNCSRVATMSDLTYATDHEQSDAPSRVGWFAAGALAAAAAVALFLYADGHFDSQASTMIEASMPALIIEGG